MKANELMIGDWVTYVNRKDHWAGRIVALRKDGQIQIDITDGSTAINKYFHFKPIPLTLEILEKNNALYNDSLYCLDGLFLSYNEEKDNFDIGDIGIGFYGDEFHYFTTIDCVHQLQHALRLCGIDKEIVL